MTRRSQSSLLRTEKLNDIIMPSIPISWPLFPYFPVINKKRKRNDQIGCLVAINTLDPHRKKVSLYTVFLCSIIDITSFTIDEILELKKETYETEEEMIKAGWDLDVMVA